MSLGELLVIAAVAWALHRAYQKYQDAKTQLNLDRINLLAQRIANISHFVVSEQHEDMHYWFDNRDQFLAQGRTIDELVDVLKSRFPDHIFFIGQNLVLSQGTEWRLARLDS